MKLILLSGGSGKRLWPMSNDSRSKQFLKVLKSETGQAQSMVQRVWDQLSKVGLQQDAYVCASRAQREMIQAQLGDVPFIEEPARRDTFPAISLAALYLADAVDCADDEVVAVIPVDHYVDGEYFLKITELGAVLNDSNADLALLGVDPTEPTSKFGYIRVGATNTGQSWYPVKAFVEKPDHATAATLIAEGALWNCGVFCFRLGYLKEILRRSGYPVSYRQLAADFDALPKRSFDYEVVEKADTIAVSKYAGQWEDLGTWGALSEQMSESFVGNGEAVDCADTHVINELAIPVVAMGLQQTIVITTPDGILVADKTQSAGLKNVIGAYSGRPMYEERRWGSYRVMDYQKLDDGTEVMTNLIDLYKGHNISYHRHFKRSEVWTILEGEGELVLDTRILSITAGDVVRIYAEQWHAIRAKTAMKLIEVQRGSELIETDIVRRYLDWAEITRHCAGGLQ
jgi:mannose-1-phosphate guanylyltransferase